MGNAASTLGELVAPLTEAEFLSLLRERKLTYLPAAEGDCYTRYANWLDWDALVRLIERGEYPRGRGDVRVSKESITAPPDRWTSNGRLDVAKLEEHQRSGYSIVITHMESYVPPLAALCDEIRARFLEKSFVGVIVTTGKDGAFKLHYDPEDLIIIQIEGTKRWQIFGPPVSNPVIGMAKQTPPDGAPMFDKTLQRGDLLFVPGGNWHHCEAGPGRSVHLGIFFLPPTGWNAVQSLTSQLLSDEIFRTPLTRLDGVATVSEMEADLKNRLVEKVRDLDLKDFVAQWNKKRGS